MPTTATVARDEVEAVFDAAIKAGQWALAEQLERVLYPEHFEDHPDADPYCEDCNEVYPAGAAHTCPVTMTSTRGCECELDWKCDVCTDNGYYHSILDR